MSDIQLLDREAGCLMGSRDAGTGEVYFPPRPYAADGSMRETKTVPLSVSGTLYSWTALGPVHYGQIDLPEGVLLQCEIAPGEHEIGATYQLEITGDSESDWRYARA